MSEIKVTIAPKVTTSTVLKTGATGLPGAVGATGASTWDAVTGKPSTFTPSAHIHAIADTTGLQTALDGKQASGSYAPASDISPTAITGTAATKAQAIAFAIAL